MEYRIMKDCAEPPIFWIEKLQGGDWMRVFGTTAFDAGESWSLVQQNIDSIVTPAEVKYLLDRRRTDRLEQVVWSEIERQSRLQLRRETRIRPLLTNKLR